MPTQVGSSVDISPNTRNLDKKRTLDQVDGRSRESIATKRAETTGTTNNMSTNLKPETTLASGESASLVERLTAMAANYQSKSKDK